MWERARRSGMDQESLGVDLSKELKMRGPLKDSSGKRFPRFPITPAQKRRKTLEANLKAAAPYTSDRLR